MRAVNISIADFIVLQEQLLKKKLGKDREKLYFNLCRIIYANN